MDLYEWEIWHNYSTYLSVQKIDLESVAKILVESELAVCAMSRDGRTFWRSDSGIKAGLTKIAPNSYNTHATIQIKCDHGDDIDLEDFAQEAWYQTAYFRFNETMLFGESAPLPPAYLKAYMGQFNFVSNDGFSVHCYPIIKLFETGILLIELRTISPEQPIPLEMFINNYVNLGREPFNKVEVPPAVTKYATYAYYQNKRKWPIHLRAGLLYMERGHEIAVKEHTRSSTSGDFTFEFAPLSGTESDEHFETLSSVALTLFNIIGYLISKPRKGINYIIRGQKQLITMGNYWAGRPHIYLIRFENQKDNSKENEKHNSSSFGQIMAKVNIDDSQDSKVYLPKDSRRFDDFNAYIHLAASLWVWSKKGINNQNTWEDGNRGHLIYEHQAKIELLEYAYMLHRSLLDRCNNLRNSDEVLIARRDLAKLKLAMKEASHFGEIREQLMDGWSEMGINDLQELITESLLVRESHTVLKESRSIQKMGLTLTVLFGLIAVPGFAQGVVQPLWDWLDIWKPADKNASTLLFMGISFLLVQITVFGLYKFSKSKKEIK